MKAKTTTTIQWERESEVLFEDFLKGVEHFCLMSCNTDKGLYFKDLYSSELFQMSETAASAFDDGDYSHLVIQKVKKPEWKNWLNIVIYAERIHKIK